MIVWDQILQQKPCELVITGPNGKKQIEKDNGLNEIIFQVSSLNFLEVSSVGLAEVSPRINSLSHLTSLVFRGNSLTAVPSHMGQLTKLKLLDLSWNKLTELPAEISGLTELQSLILSGNELSALPSDLSKLSALIVVKIDQNKFNSLPDGLFSEENAKVRLAEIHAQKNQITEIPGTINRLVSLRVLDLRENCLTSVPGEVGDCPKLKDISLSGNKFADRRFGRVVEQNKPKQILDYIRAHFPKGQSKSGSEKTGRTGRTTSQDRQNRAKDARQRRRSSSRSSAENSLSLMDTIRIQGQKENQYTITMTPAALEQRKIVACIVRNVDLSRENVLKRFLAVQTGLHDGICCKRSVATIAVHDLDKIKGAVTFDVKPPTKMRFLPLGRNKEMNASELYKTLIEEAENVRKEKKRNTFSGIHKYLYLLKGKTRYCCLIDSEGTILSFPPITNSETTKVRHLITFSCYLTFNPFPFQMEEQTKNLLIEVTGESQPTCKKVMDALLHAMLKQGVGAGRVETSVKNSDQNDVGIDIRPHLLEVEPARICDAEGKLYVLYPSRVDLIFEDVNVIRES